MLPDMKVIPEEFQNNIKIHPNTVLVPIGMTY